MTFSQNIIGPVLGAIFFKFSDWNHEKSQNLSKFYGPKISVYPNFY